MLIINSIDSPYIIVFVVIDFPEVVEVANNRNKRKPGPASFCCTLFPCLDTEDRREVYECKDTSKHLLADTPNNDKDNNSHVTNMPPPSYPRGGGNQDGAEISTAEAGNVYRGSTTPSAPAIDYNDFNPTVDMKGQHFYDRSDSVPAKPIT